MAKIIQGVGVSEGIAVNKAIFVNNANVEVTQKDSTDPAREITKFKDAVFTTVNQFLDLEKEASKNDNTKEYDILEVYIQMAKDPIFTMNVSQFINQKKCNAEYAVQQIAHQVYEKFNNMDDQYFRDRGVDINDVSYRIIKNILGVKNIDLTSIKEEGIVIVNNLTPTMMTLVDPKYVKGIITNVSGYTSHVAIMAKSINIPTVLNAPQAFKEIKDGELIAADGSTGEIYYGLDSEDEKLLKEKQQSWDDIQTNLESFSNKEAKTKDGISINVEGNINAINEITDNNVNTIDAVGLFRTEYIYLNSSDLPAEDEQYKIYQSLSDKMPNKRVVIRTMDIGGDKNVGYLHLPKSTNPFLGLRGLRYSLHHPDVFRTQLKAILRAGAKNKNVCVMFPMVAEVEEFRQAREIVEQCKKELTDAKVAFDQDMPVGMMVEIPAAALNIDSFVKYVDFFSIGTNDLMQYTMAANRLDENVAYLYQPTNPGLLRLIKHVADTVIPTKKRIVVCGEMANDYMALPLLVGMGIKEFSVPIPKANQVKALVTGMYYQQAKFLVDQAIVKDTHAEVMKLVEDFYERSKESN